MQNNSGVSPLDKRILVKPDSVEEVTKGGIILVAAHAERDKYAMTKGTLVAVGETAWSEAVADAHNHGRTFTPPAPGDRIMMAKYGGTIITGTDGEEYRLLNDEELIGRLVEEAA